MNSGSITYLTSGRLFNTVGSHQKFDKSAYRCLQPLIDTKHFPAQAQILKFEGMGGPDGLKFKAKNYRADHLWDPINKIGYLPVWIEIHFTNLVKALKKQDTVKAAFEAGFMAHYLTDSLTPAHHVSTNLIAAEYKDASKARKGWLYFGHKGIVSSHVMFETGVSSAVAFNRLKIKFDQDLYRRIQQLGIKAVVEDESLRIARLNLYDQYLKKGWSANLAKTVKTVVVKRIPQLIAAAWLVAYEQAGFEVQPTTKADQS